MARIAAPAALRLSCRCLMTSAWARRSSLPYHRSCGERADRGYDNNLFMVAIPFEIVTTGRASCIPTGRYLLQRLASKRTGQAAARHHDCVWSAFWEQIRL